MPLISLANFSKLSYPIFTLRFGPFGLESGVNSTRFRADYEDDSLGEISLEARLSYYVANLRYYMFEGPLSRLYLGGGMVGFRASGNGKITDPSTNFSAEATTTAMDFLGGVEVFLDKFGLPLTFFGGLDTLYFQDLNTELSSNITIPGPTEEILREGLDYNLKVFMYHFGVRYDF